MVTSKTHVANLRQTRRRRTFSDEYKRNVLKTVAELIETAPNKIGLFLKKEGLTWPGIQQWKEQINGVPSENSISENISEETGGVKNVQVGRVDRAHKYRNVTLDRLYTENLRLKERLAEMEQNQKKAKLIVELQTKMMDILEVESH